MANVFPVSGIGLCRPVFDPQPRKVLEILNVSGYHSTTVLTRRRGDLQTQLPDLEMHELRAAHEPDLDFRTQLGHALLASDPLGTDRERHIRACSVAISLHALDENSDLHTASPIGVTWHSSSYRDHDRVPHHG